MKLNTGLKWVRKYDSPINGSKYSRMGQVNLRKNAFKKFEV